MMSWYKILSRSQSSRAAVYFIYLHANLTLHWGCFRKLFLFFAILLPFAPGSATGGLGRSGLNALCMIRGRLGAKYAGGGDLFTYGIPSVFI
jgi:hypothetical protein